MRTKNKNNRGKPIRLLSGGATGVVPYEGAQSFSITGPARCDDVIMSEWPLQETDCSETFLRAGLFSELMSLPSRYAEEGWDGYSAASLSEESFSSAVSFVEKMPIRFPQPRIVVDPDGDICFKWEKSRNNRIELTFSKRNTYYAVFVRNGMRTLIGSTSRDEITMNAERVLGWR